MTIKSSIKAIDNIGSNINKATSAMVQRMPIVQGSSVLVIGEDYALVQALLIAAHYDCQVTCLYPHYKVTETWATELGEQRVTFLDYNLSNLRSLIGKEFDVALLTLDWIFIFGDECPETTIIAPEGVGNSGSYNKGNNNHIIDFLNILGQLVIPNGLLIMECVVTQNIKGMIQGGPKRYKVVPNWILNIMLPCCDEDDRLVVMIFTNSNDPSFIEDLLFVFPQKGLSLAGVYFYDLSAQKIRRFFFSEARTIIMSEYEWCSNKERIQVELMQEKGLGLLYQKSSFGGHFATIFLESFMSPHVKAHKSFLRDGNSKGYLIIIR